MNKALFLDRDGVINKEVDHLYKINDVEFEKGIFETLQKIKNYLLIIVTNQAGIAKGLYTVKDFEKLDSWMHDQFKKNNIRIEKTYYCPHHPNGINGFNKKCECRKPGTLMLKKAADEFDIDLNSSFIVGDKTSDILAGKNAGCKTILVQTGYAGKDGKFNVKSDYVIRDFTGILDIIKD